MKIRITLLILLLLVSLNSALCAGPVQIPSHHIKLEFDLKSHKIRGTNRLKIYPGGERELIATINKEIDILSIKGPDGSELRYSFIDEENQYKKKLIIFLPPSGDSGIWIESEYQGILEDLPVEMKSSREFISDEPTAYIGEEIVLLDDSSCWYLCIEEPATFAVTTITPPEYEAVMEGTRMVRKVEKDKTITIWSFPHPSYGPYLVAGRFNISEEKYKDIAVYTYFFPEDENLSDTYMEYSIKYLKLYEELFGKYPFGKFAVVENILPTGFGMPSYTLLGQSVLRLPFMVKTSLGHEVAHNWWGNSVYPDYDTGNWSEGLTTYVADHLYEDMEGRGASYRNQLLRDYANYVRPSEEYPLKEFKRRTGPEDRAIGYGKSAYVFHMLKKMIGDEAFHEGLRHVAANYRFKKTSWDDLRLVFEKVSNKELGWFFKQWVERVGAPSISLGDIQVERHHDGYRLSIDLIQKDELFDLYVPVSIETEKGTLLSHQWVKDLNNRLNIEVPARPLSVTIDPESDVFRKLSPDEIPATIGKFMGARQKLALLPSGTDQEKIGAYFKMVSEMDIKDVKIDRTVTKEEVRNKSTLILGSPEENIWMRDLMANLPSNIKIERETISINGNSYSRKDSVLALATVNPYNTDEVILLFLGNIPEHILSVGARLSHYGKYSYLLFVNGVNREKGIWNAPKIHKKIGAEHFNLVMFMP